METYRILKSVELTPEHPETGFTRHYFGAQILPKPVTLQIVQYPGKEGFYLFYLDAKGEIQNDTFHESLEGAMEQAQLEFLIKPDEWKDSFETKRVYGQPGSADGGPANKLGSHLQAVLSAIALLQQRGFQPIDIEALPKVEGNPTIILESNDFRIGIYPQTLSGDTTSYFISLGPVAAKYSQMISAGRLLAAFGFQMKDTDIAAIAKALDEHYDDLLSLLRDKHGWERLLRASDI